MSAYGQCRAPTCRAKILWARTAAGRLQPLDPDPDPNGLILLTGRRTPEGFAIVERTMGLEEAKTSPEPASRRFTAHHATCPARKDFRR